MSSPASTASSALPAGSRLGEFEITGVIGEGGFGIVYSARDSSLDRIVAIKEYLPAAFASRNSTGMVHVRSEENSKTFNAGLSSFINEARMLAKFSHPGLVEVFRFWEGNGTAYMAMRYYRGVTLREMLRTNPQVVTEQWLCETLDPILLALQELHHEKCYHRDIAPDNILVLPNGRSVLMDFGAARRIIGGMTRALTTVLKPGYAPIEQYSDDGSMAQGAWTDIYAVGGVLYHAMTGKVPVQAISRMMNDPLKPVAAAARSEFSPVLTDAVMKCLSVMPENRYQTIDELRAALGWVTTPVSSTVVFSKTTMATPVNNLLTTAAASLPPTPSVAVPVAAVPSVALDPMAALAVSSPATGDALSDLLSTPNVSVSKAPAVASTVKPAQQSRAAVEGGDVRVFARDDGVDILALGVAALVVIGAGYFFVAGKSDPAVQAVQPSITPPVVSPTQPSVPAAPVAEPTPTPAPAVADPKPVDTAPPPPPIVATPTPEAPATTPLATGTVTFAIKPWGNIVVDGISKGASPPLKRLALPPGSHTIEIQNPAGSTVSRTIEVVSGKSVPVRHAF